MGYRSEVIAGVPLKDKKKALKIIEEWDQTSEDNPVRDDERDFFYMRAEYWKWYNGYPDVDKFEKFIGENEDRFMIALGEDGAVHSTMGEPFMHEIWEISYLDNSIKWEERNAANK